MHISNFTPNDDEGFDTYYGIKDDDQAEETE